MSPLLCLQCHYYIKELIYSDLMAVITTCTHETVHCKDARGSAKIVILHTIARRLAVRLILLYFKLFRINYVFQVVLIFDLFCGQDFITAKRISFNSECIYWILLIHLSSPVLKLHSPSLGNSQWPESCCPGACSSSGRLLRNYLTHLCPNFFTH